MAIGVACSPLTARWHWMPYCSIAASRCKQPMVIIANAYHGKVIVQAAQQIVIIADTSHGKAESKKSYNCKCIQGASNPTNDYSCKCISWKSCMHCTTMMLGRRVQKYVLPRFKWGRRAWCDHMEWKIWVLKSTVWKSPCWWLSCVSICNEIYGGQAGRIWQGKSLYPKSW